MARTSTLLCGLIAASLLTAAGCGGGAATDGHSVAGNEVQEAMAALSDADRKLAEAQKVCILSDEPLGTMGTPPKLTLNGREVFICCEGCRDTVEADPDKFLAKLDAAIE